MDKKQKDIRQELVKIKRNWSKRKITSGKKKKTKL